MDYNFWLFVELDSTLEKQEQVLSPYDNFLYALKAKETKRQYPHRLDKFLSFMGFKGTIEEKCAELYHYTKKNNDSNIIQSYLIKFINYQKQRIENKEISEGTLSINQTTKFIALEFLALASSFWQMFVENLRHNDTEPD